MDKKLKFSVIFTIIFLFLSPSLVSASEYTAVSEGDVLEYQWNTNDENGEGSTEITITVDDVVQDGDIVYINFTRVEVGTNSEGEEVNKEDEVIINVNTTIIPGNSLENDEDIVFYITLSLAFNNYFISGPLTLEVENYESGDTTLSVSAKWNENGILQSANMESAEGYSFSLKLITIPSFNVSLLTVMSFAAVAYLLLKKRK